MFYTEEELRKAIGIGFMCCEMGFFPHSRIEECIDETVKTINYMREEVNDKANATV